MGRVVAIEAIAFAGCGFLYDTFVGRLFVEFDGISMAIEADGVIVRLAHVDW